MAREQYVIKEAKPEAREESIKESKEEEKKEIARKMLRLRMPMDTVIEISGLSLEEITAIKNNTE